MGDTEELSGRRKKNWRKLIPIFIPVLIITVLVTAEYIISHSPQFRYSQWYSAILGLAIININIILILVLLVVIFRNLFKLFSERKRKILGSRFRTKLVLTMIGIILISTLVPYLIASDLISKSIDRWYAQPVDDIVSSSRRLSDIYLEDYEELALAQTLSIADFISEENLLNYDKYIYLRVQYLEPLMDEIKFDVIDIYLGEERLVPTIVDPRSPLLPYIGDPDPGYLQRVLRLQRRSSTGYYAWREVTPEGSLLRCAAPVFDRNDESDEARPIGSVVLGFGVRRNLVNIATAITGDYRVYREQVEQREVVQPASQALLLVATMMCLFSALWIGIYFSRRVTVPIQQLAIGTRAVAAGNLDHRVDAAADDELGLLVDSFNKMTQDLKHSQEELEEANRSLVLTNQEIERRRRYTETLLANLSSAVISIDSEGLVSTVNPRARELLALPLRGLVGMDWREAFGRPDLAPLREIVEHFFDAGIAVQTQDLELRLEQRLLHLSATITSIHHADGALRGSVIVLDDLTQLVRAQRSAAWQEVAQRIAHEIKNPLTPIQLSAERIRRKIAEEGSDYRDLVAKSTETIIEETGTLKSMVDAFGSFARMPPLDLRRTDVNAVLEKAVSIYRDDAEGDGFRIVKQFGREVPEMDLDADQFKMAFVNIINNAIDATDGRGRLEISSRFDSERKAVVVEFADDGPGIPPEVKDKLFLPYFSTKKKGTGLGLAIVMRIINDHKGTISVADNEPKGTRFTIELPAE